MPCIQSQFMRFVLVAGFLTQSYRIPNPNPPSDVITDISRGEGMWRAEGAVGVSPANASCKSKH